MSELKFEIKDNPDSQENKEDLILKNDKALATAFRRQRGDCSDWLCEIRTRGKGSAGGSSGACRSR